MVPNRYEYNLDIIWQTSGGAVLYGSCYNLQYLFSTSHSEALFRTYLQVNRADKRLQRGPSCARHKKQ